MICHLWCYLQSNHVTIFLQLEEDNKSFSRQLQIKSDNLNKIEDKLKIAEAKLEDAEDRRLHYEQ